MTVMRLARALPLLLCVLMLPVARAEAQARRGVAEVTPIEVARDVHAGGVALTALRVELPAGYHVNSHIPRDPSLIPLSVAVSAPVGTALAGLAFPTPSILRQQGSDQPLSVFERSFTIGARLQVAPDAPPGDLRVPFRLRYQACDETRCYLPATITSEWTLRVVPAGTAIASPESPVFRALVFDAPAPSDLAASQSTPEAASRGSAPSPSADPRVRLDAFTISGSDGGYLRADAFLTFLRNAERGVRPTGLFDGHGPLAILLIVFLGGLALNLTPCVLPMIPINLAIIGAGSQAGSRAQGLRLGAVYGAAMAVVYGVLGLIVVLTARTFGAINASPWFNVAIAVLFCGLALAMFDVFVIDFSRFSSRVRPGGRRGSVALAFGMGAVAALLAGACVAPVVIQVVVLSGNLYASGHTAALALPFVLGIGMAVPWPVAGAGLAALPKPGAWMVRVKQGFGVAIMVMAAYYGHTAFTLFADRRVDPAQVTSSVEAKVTEGWYASLPEGLAAAQQQNRLVLVDLWATWCKNCLAMDRTTLVDPAVTHALDGYIKVKFQAEAPDAPLTRDIMQRFGVVGLPAYVVLTPRSDNRNRDR